MCLLFYLLFLFKKTTHSSSKDQPLLSGVYRFGPTDLQTNLSPLSNFWELLQCSGLNQAASVNWIKFKERNFHTAEQNCCICHFKHVVTHIFSTFQPPDFCRHKNCAKVNVICFFLFGEKYQAAIVCAHTVCLCFWLNDILHSLAVFPENSKGVSLLAVSSRAWKGQNL